MRKTFASLMVFALLIQGCGQPVEESSVITTEAATETITEDAVYAVEATTREETFATARSTSVPVFFREDAEEAWNARLEYDGSGLREIPYVVTDYGETEQWITDISVENECYADLAAAVENFEAEILGPYTGSSIYAFYRCDNRLLSLGVEAVSFIPQGDGISRYYQTYMTRTFDYQGNVLLFTDVVNGDYDYFLSVADSVIREKFGREADTILQEMEDLEDPDSIKFYMTEDSLVFYIDDIIGFEDAVVMDYMMYADCFDPRYLPGDGILIAQLSDVFDTGHEAPTVHDDFYDDGFGYFYVAYGEEQSFIVAEYMASEEGYSVVQRELCQDSGRLVVLYDENFEEVGEEIFDYPLDGLTQRYWNTEHILDFTMRITDNN